MVKLISSGSVQKIYYSISESPYSLGERNAENIITGEKL